MASFLYIGDQRTIRFYTTASGMSTEMPMCPSYRRSFRVYMQILLFFVSAFSPECGALFFAGKRGKRIVPAGDFCYNV